MSTAMTHQRDAVASGYWPLWRYEPEAVGRGEHPFHLDSKRPTLPLAEFTTQEARYAMLARTDPARAEQLAGLAQADVDARRRLYEQLAEVDRGPEDAAASDDGAADADGKDTA
jgi:pyruvate-ferredoxin/flavodoxin oxidoreductase